MTSFDMRMFARLRATSENRYEPEYARAFANLYWRALLALACIVIVGAGVYGTVVFLGALSRPDAGATTAGPGIPAGSNLNRPQLDAILQGFAARQETFKSLQSGSVPSVQDPSK